MDTILISWEDRLAELYEEAGASGADAHTCEEAWFVNARWQYGRFALLDLEPIPDEEYAKWVEYANTPEEV